MRVTEGDVIFIPSEFKDVFVKHLIEWDRELKMSIDRAVLAGTEEAPEGVDLIQTANGVEQILCDLEVEGYEFT